MFIFVALLNVKDTYRIGRIKVLITTIDIIGCLFGLLKVERFIEVMKIYFYLINSV